MDTNLIFAIVPIFCSYSFFGPVGLVPGAVLGFFISMHLRRLSLDLIVRNWRIGNFVLGDRVLLQRESVLLTNLAGLCARVAASDGNLNSSEYGFFQYILKDVLKVRRGYWRNSRSIMDIALASNKNVQSFALQYFNVFSEQRVILVDTVDFLFMLAATDGKLNDQEEEAIRTISSIFGISTHEYQYHLKLNCPTYSYGASGGVDRDSEKSPIEIKRIEAYKLFGATDRDPIEDITRKYRRLMMDYHPDKIQSKDVPDGFVEFANEKVLQIKEAYEIIKREKK